MATLHTSPTTTSLASNLRRYILDAQSHALSHHPTFRIAVSGGSLPSILAEALLHPPPQSQSHPQTETPQFSSWTIFFADERLVPATDPDSNYGLLERELLSKIPATLGKPTVHTISPALLSDAQEAADEYEKQLVSVFAAKDSVKLPTFDLLLLGCGPDGHTCSLFPGHELLEETVGWVLPIEDSPKPPARRVTLSLPVVVGAARVAFVAAGEGKKGVIRGVFEGEADGKETPCGIVTRRTGERCTWFTDEAAGGGVKGAKKGSL